MFFHKIKDKYNNKKKYKICVYCIAKNESKFVDRFMDSIEEIKNHVYVLDTGSTDDTVELFKKRGATVHQKYYDKFEFDVARNDSLDLVPEDYDICICLDIDEIITNGFTDVINNIWKTDTTQMEYPTYYKVDKNGNPIVQFMNNKIHSRKNFKWIYPIHEVLEYTGYQPNIVQTNEILVIHKPDVKKDRNYYMGLLEERVKNFPDDKRNLLLLAREYNNHKKYEKCIEIATKFLNLEKNYIPHKIQAMCYLANSYREIKQFEEAELWADKALEEPEITREPYLQKIIINYNKKDYSKVIKYGQEALKIENYNKRVIDSSYCWDGTIYDYMSLAYYYMKDYDNAIKYIDFTINLNPDIKRLKENRKLFLETKSYSKKT